MSIAFPFESEMRIKPGKLFQIVSPCFYTLRSSFSSSFFSFRRVLIKEFFKWAICMENRILRLEFCECQLFKGKYTCVVTREIFQSIKIYQILVELNLYSKDSVCLQPLICFVHKISD